MVRVRMPRGRVPRPSRDTGEDWLSDAWAARLLVLFLILFWTAAGLAIYWMVTGD